MFFDYHTMDGGFLLSISILMTSKHLNKLIQADTLFATLLNSLMYPLAPSIDKKWLFIDKNRNIKAQYTVL